MVTFRYQDVLNFLCEARIAVLNSPTTTQLSDIQATIDQLTVEDKATLDNHVLGNNGFSRVFNGHRGQH